MGVQKSTGDGGPKLQCPKEGENMKGKKGAMEMRGGLTNR